MRSCIYRGIKMSHTMKVVEVRLRTEESMKDMKSADMREEDAEERDRWRR